MDNKQIYRKTIGFSLRRLLWDCLSLVHATFIKPFVLTGVLRNFIDSGKEDIPSEASFRLPDAKSPKFRKLHSEL